MSKQSRKIGEILVRAGVIESKDVDRVLDFQKESGERFASACATLGLAEERELVRALATQTGMPAIVLDESVVAMEMIDLLPFKLATNRGVLSVGTEGDRLLVASSGPLDPVLEDEIRFVAGKPAEGLLALDGALSKALRKAHGARMRGGRSHLAGKLVSPLAKATHKLVLVQPSSTPTEIPDIPAPPPGPWTGEVEAYRPSQSGEATDGAEGPAATVPGDHLSIQPSDRPGSEAGAPGPQKLVVVVDDDADICATVTALIEGPEVEVVSYGDGTEALAQIARRVPDLLVLDAMLPGVHGFEICRRIKQSAKFAKTPVIMITAVYRGWEMGEDVKESFGADEYFEKPFDVDRFCGVVERYLAGPGTPKPEVLGLSGEGLAKAKTGERLLREEKPKEALECLEEALVHGPFHPRVHYLCGVAYRKLKRNYHAISSFEKAIEFKEDHFAALKELAVLYERSGFRAKARQIWQRAVSSAPSEEAAELIRAHLKKLY